MTSPPSPSCCSASSTPGWRGSRPCCSSFWSRGLSSSPRPRRPCRSQQKIMHALHGKQLTTDQLLAEVGVDRKQLFGRWGLAGLKEQGLVANKGDRKGYFRPDAPPSITTKPAT